MQKITPILWFNNEAEDAANFYTSIFKDSKINTMARYGAEGPGPAGQVMTATFSLNGQEFLALNGGPKPEFMSAAHMINCETQEDVDYFWEKLSEGGEPGQCGWLKDRFGLSWNVVPTILGKLMGGNDAAKSQRVMHAMLQMKKLDIAKLQDAAGEQ